jgi:hypothetical protein
MPEIHRKLMVTFSKAEIQEILTERAKALVLTRKDAKRYDGDTVSHVEGEAVVTMWVREKDSK